ncbi:tetratricopeptide repeat protein [Methanobrevibacter curvatus]|uniref:Beta-barrel assembly-enhancing protease n=1 Tax=Methanobrevibacter curvatus TaxID=49547 RepID=A0A166CMY5_9EURY|nr:tetratricopeptide repeat protein [Methanobrevibacter curvatus]KZX14679.1 beta-barrel assembly-enhancing protease [Methanobrevibacter curvatus]
MPILSFGSQNIELITGNKTSTIRKLWKSPLKEGNRLHCYWNLVSKEKKKIFEAVVVGVELIEFKDLKNNDETAIQEGFKDAKDMLKEFKKMYVGEIKDNDMFQIIHFEKLPVSKWEGEKIDEKAMITQRADILFDTGKYDKSTICYTAALKHDPDDVYLLNKQGDNLSRLGQFKEAIKYYDKALKIQPNNEYIYNNKAIALLNSGNPNESLNANNMALKYNKKNSAILYWRILILQVLQRFEDALSVSDELIKIDGKNPEVWNARGNLLTEMEHHEEAIEAYDIGFTHCFDESEIDASALNRKGNVLLDLGRFNEALSVYDKAIKIEPNNEWFLLNKGLVLLELNNFSQASDVFTKVLSINPKNDDARVLRDECLENM